MIFGIPPGVLFVILVFYVPHALLLGWIILAFKKWKQQKTSAWKAALISSIPALVVLIGFSIPLTREVIVGPPDPFFFMPLLGILVIALPIALGIFILGWCLAIICMRMNARIKNTPTDVTRRQFILSLTIPALVLVGAVLVFYYNSVIKKATSPDTSPEALTQLSHYPLLWVRQEVARNPHTPTEVLNQFFQERLSTGYRVYTEELAKNPSTPPEILRVLYGELKDYFWLDYFIAENPSTPEDILREMASRSRREQSGYALGLARNPKLPKDLVDKLRNNPSPMMREALKKVHGDF